MSKELNCENIYENPLYRNVMYLILRSTTSGKKIKFQYLNYKLVKAHGITDLNKIQKIKDFYRFDKKAIEIVETKSKKGYKENKIQKITYERLLKKVNRTMFDSVFFDKTAKFNIKSSLSNYLNRLQKINPKLIEKKHDRSGSYYIATEEGIASFYRFFHKEILKKYVPVDKLELSLYNLLKVMV